MATEAVQKTSLSWNSSDGDSRLEDYLNDKLQTYADFESIDVLLRNVVDQQNLLRQQLADAESSMQQASLASQSHSTTVQTQIEEFRGQQQNIDRRLMVITRSDTSDEAVKKFDSSMSKLRRLDVAKAYVDLLSQVEHLSTETRSSFNKSPQDALRPYVQLQELAFALKEAQPAAEDAAPHLVDHVEYTTKSLWKQMREAFSSKFEITLKKMRWPNKDVYLDGPLGQEWAEGVEQLLELQDPELKSHGKAASSSKYQDDALVLLPLETMVKPLELRFQYHFEGDKPTNRLDKPEYFLSHIVGIFNSYEDFFASYLQPILSHHFKGSNLALNSLYIDSTAALITAVLPMLRRKIRNYLPLIAKQPQLLSHFIHELMSFDTSMRNDWGYDGGQGAGGWRGLTWEVLVKHDWFQKWLGVEKDFAFSRYQSIIDPPESREIDYDSVDPGVTKPTKAAIRVNDLLESVTDRYRNLASFHQKLRFLIDIQITIFDKFHEDLHSSLEAYLAMTSSVARAVQGISKEEQAKVQGLNGFERLCRVYGSAEYLEKKMNDWSDDVFFLELWDELQYRAQKNTSGDDKTVGDSSISEAVQRVSSNTGSSEQPGGLFDETATSYRRLRVRTEEIIQENLNYDIRESLRSYGRISSWASINTDTQALSSSSISTELDAPIQKLTSYLSFLRKILGSAPLRRISRQLCLSIQTFIWDHLILRNNFSTAGVTQLRRDLEALWAVLDRYIGSGQGRTSMRKLSDTLQLLGMPIKASNDKDESLEPQNAGKAKTLSIWEVEKRVFKSNESAREVLEELGLENLTESEARTILEKRVELAS